MNKKILLWIKHLVFVLSMLQLFGTAVFAQQSTRQGTVVGQDDGMGLPGVNILIKGTTRGTVTDIDGRFSIAASSDATLVFTFIGYKSLEVPVGNSSVLNISKVVFVAREIGLRMHHRLATQTNHVGYAF